MMIAHVPDSACPLSEAHQEYECGRPTRDVVRAKINKAVRLLSFSSNHVDTPDGIAAIILNNLATMVANIESRLWRAG